MKHLLAWPIWYHPDVVELIVDAVVQFEDPARAELLFFFDGNDPESIASFNKCAHKLKEFKWNSDGSADEINEYNCHRKILEWFDEWSDAASVVIHQDDTRPSGPTMLADLDRVLEAYGNSIGYVGCRDGYDLRYGSFISSPWSGSDKAQTKLPIGQFVPRMMMNPGPLIYPRSTVEKVGNIHPGYRAWYFWDDYALSCAHAGLNNVLLSTDCIHQKHGKGKPSVIYQDKEGWVTADLALLNQRWAPHFGGNVI